MLFAQAYSEAAPLLMVLAWAGVFSSIGVARSSLIIAKNWTRINMVSVGLGSALNVLLNYQLIPRYGAMGAVISTCISYWFAVHGTCLFLPPLRKTGGMITRALLFPKVW